MSQEQLRREDDPIKYGEVFDVSGDLAAEKVAPRDAAMMQSAENLVLGQTKKGGPAAVMQSAADYNEQISKAGHTEASKIAGERGVTVAEADTPGGLRVVTESVGGQVVGQCVEPMPAARAATMAINQPAMTLESETITIGEALEASAMTRGGKPVDQSDAAAIQAAEVRATGSNIIKAGGVAATAQSAATANTRTTRDEAKTTLAEVLSDATRKLPRDKPVTRQDAEGVISAELRNNPNLATHPGGVAASMAAAAKLNETIEPSN
ncbi:late embryogenesis abundant protein D-34-like [Aristolochia californica]|uniref:late embryogenesis abundant protein D-34-like n=1 Tax=Aristolochia californica TaxID=171875 RepID=UPI0035E0A66E